MTARRPSQGFSERVRSGVGLVLIAMLAAPPLTAQEPRVLEGTVIAVQGDRARLEITSSRLPAPGDSVWLGTEMRGVGDVMLDGRWRVAEVNGTYAWVDPVGAVAKPLPGYAAAIFSDNPIDAPDDPEPGVEVLYSRDFGGGGTSSESDGPYCRTRNTASGFLIRTVAESGGCVWNLWGSGVLEPPLRISTTIHMREGEPNWGYGLQFGTDRASSAYHVLFISNDGGYHLGRREESGWVGMAPWSNHPAIATGVGARNELTVELEGNTVHYAVNGIHVGSQVGPGPVTGYVGFYLSNPGQELLFENVRVERLGTGTSRTSAESLVHEDFGDASSWNEVDGPPCRTRNTGDGFSVHNIAESGSCYWNLWRFGEIGPNARIDVEIGMGSGPQNNGYGIKFATADRQNSDYYAFLVSGDGHYELIHWNSGKRRRTQVIPWQRHEAVNTGVGATNRLTVETRGNTADLYVNNQYVHTYQAPRSLGGYLALYINAPNIEGVFKDLRVEPLHGSR